MSVEPIRFHSEDQEPRAIRIRPEKHTARKVIICIAFAVIALGAGAFAYLKLSSSLPEISLPSFFAGAATPSDAAESESEPVSRPVKSKPQKESKASSSSSESSEESEPVIESVPEPESEPEPKGPDRDEWDLVIANKASALPSDYKVTAKEYGENGIPVDVRIQGELTKLISAAANEGYSLSVVTGYRSYEKQSDIFNKKVEELMFLGYTEEAAKETAVKSVALPGTSDHNTGLGVDIVNTMSQSISAESASYQWLCDNAWEYGFVLRYPADKTEVTGFSFEPWHWRFVGEENAKAMHESGLCLEEYLG